MSFVNDDQVTLADSAEECAAEGWHVFPLVPRSKAPLTPNGFLDATTDLGRVRRWWRQHPDANIGARTGVVFDVIDVDGDNGFRTLAPLIAAHGPLEAGAIAVTPGKVKGGVHVGTGAHYFVAVTGLGYTSFGGNLEMKAAGGYVVLPPSIHPDGGTYEWAYVRAAGEAFPAAPDWVFEPSRRKEAQRRAEVAERERRRAERPASDGESVMERFNARATWRAILEPEGWTYSHTHGDNEYWCRPGKTPGQGHGASINDLGDGVLYVFTDGTVFEPGEAYSKFAAYAIVRHRGDFSRAARTLAEWWRRQEAA